MRRTLISLGGTLLVAATALAAGALVGVSAGAASAGATTMSGTLVGEGGSYLQPVTSKLLHDDGTNLLPDFGAYTNTDLDQGIADFVGSAPDQFAADYVVSERALTAAEASTAQANGRSFAYVPFAAAPVAVVNLVPTASFGTQTIQPSDFCPHVQLSLTDLATLYGFDSANPLVSWGDSRLQCSDSAPLEPLGPGLAGNLDPTMENYALMSLLDSTPSSKALFDAGLENRKSVTTDDTPSEHWPYGGGIPGGDEVLIGKLIGINDRTNAPSSLAAFWQLGTTFPVSSVWTGAPLGTPWNLPTAAIQNAQGSYVAPSTGAASADEADASLASTTDPSTNNLVTFNPSATDATAYNSYLMEESYLVVPLNGLPADKATALAQFIRFVLGPTGQADVSSFGAAPATQAMVAAGLKIAQAVDEEAAASTAAATAASTTTTTSTTASTTATTAATSTTTTVGSAAVGSNGGSSSGSSSAGGSSSSSGLAFTGSDPLPLLGVGAAFVVIGELSRRRLRRRGARS
jgi:ABC-type phosphate transport system substrate-binding protein